MINNIFPGLQKWLKYALNMHYYSNSATILPQVLDVTPCWIETVTDFCEQAGTSNVVDQPTEINKVSTKLTAEKM